MCSNIRLAVYSQLREPLLSLGASQGSNGLHMRGLRLPLSCGRIAKDFYFLCMGSEHMIGSVSAFYPIMIAPPRQAALLLFFESTSFFSKAHTYDILRSTLNGTRPACLPSSLEPRLGISPDRILDRPATQRWKSPSRTWS